MNEQYVNTVRLLLAIAPVPRALTSAHREFLLSLEVVH